MSWFSRLFGLTLRRARRAAAKGDYREAALLFVEAGKPNMAANALLTNAQRANGVEERRSRLWDALHWAVPGGEEHNEISGLIGLSLLDGARGRASHDRQQKVELERGIRLLEGASRWKEAAEGWGLIGRSADVARCLEQGGEVDRLEAVLDEAQAETDRRRQFQESFRAFEGAYRVGARGQAREVLEALEEGSKTPREVAKRLRELRDAWLGAGEIRFRIGAESYSVLGRMPVTLGRSESDFALRGTSVSRRHAEIGRRGSEWFVRDLGSRNGTLVEGIPIAGEAALQGTATIGLGDDVDLQISPEGQLLVMRVERGLDRGLHCIAGTSMVALPGIAASLAFHDGVPTLSLSGDGPRTLMLNDADSRGPVELLRGDRVEVDGVLLEVET